MSSPIWLGGATAVTQTDTFTPGGTITTGDSNVITLKDENNATITTVTFVTAGTTTAAAVTAGLIAAWNANATAAAIATASGTATFILAAATSGVPFYATSAVTGVGTLVRVATTASKGPNDINTVSNWSTNAAIASSDNVVIDSRGASYDLLYGLNQSSITLTTLKIYPGAPKVGQATFALMISATNVDIPGLQGSQTVTGVSRVNLNTGTNATTCNVQLTGSAADSGLEPVRITGAHASNVLIVGGSSIVGLGTNKPSDAPQFPAITVGGTRVSPTLNIGPGLVAGAACTALSGTINANQRPGGNAFGTLALAGIVGGIAPTVDFSNADAAFTVATLAIAGAGKVKVATATQGTFTATTVTFGSARSLVASLD